jgi:hypothetical protein
MKNKKKSMAYICCIESLLSVKILRIFSNTFLLRSFFILLKENKKAALSRSYEIYLVIED